MNLSLKKFAFEDKERKDDIRKSGLK